ncbi:MAG: septum formation protein Maf, partial [Deltaproteobacteria bacterium]
RAFVERIAREKAEEVAQRAPGAWVLGADTVVVLGEEVLGKPRDEEEAASMLRRLSGRVHKVLTAFSLLNLAEGRSFQGVEETKVKFIPLQEADIRWYVSTGEPLGKAGAYAIQGAGGSFIEWIKGSYTNVVGLPVAQILGPLREIGIWRP